MIDIRAYQTTYFYYYSLIFLVDKLLTFSFCAELTLWDEDYNEDDQIGDAVCLPLANLQLGKPEPRTLKFGEVSRCHVTVLRSL